MLSLDEFGSKSAGGGLARESARVLQRYLARHVSFLLCVRVLSVLFCGDRLSIPHNRQSLPTGDMSNMGRETADCSSKQSSAAARLGKRRRIWIQENGGLLACVEVCVVDEDVEADLLTTTAPNPSP